MINLKNKKAESTGIIILLILGGLGFYFFIYEEGIHNPFNKICSNEFESIITGSVGYFNSNGKCCSGFEAKTPSGFSGGAWCLSDKWNINCLYANTNNSGIYAIEKNNTTNTKLLNKVGCP